MIGHPASPLEGSNEIRRLNAGHRQVFGLAGTRTFLLAVASQFTHREPVLEDGGRSCSPLRDSSGFPPDSLIDNVGETNTGIRSNAILGCYRVNHRDTEAQRKRRTKIDFCAAFSLYLCVSVVLTLSSSSDFAFRHRKILRGRTVQNFPNL